MNKIAAEPETRENKVREIKSTAAVSAPSSLSRGEAPDLICPVCAGRIRVRVGFSNIYCGYHLIPSCPGKCEWPDEYRYDLMRRITELHYEHPEIFQTDAELTEESLAAAPERRKDESD